MLTLQQAYEVKASINEYLKATFAFKDQTLNYSFQNFIDGMFKGPYISLKLPFVKADPNEEIPLEIKPNDIPYYHQIEAFKRLTTQGGNNPKPTILTTGTGSGKTEAFLYPLLDYCYQNKDSEGIKVIILYPMNALATDQAKRLANTIHNDERLKNKIRAGLFIGESQDKKKTYPKSMGSENIIENRDEILQSPPDILLTNFKMLDFALMQSRFHNLWRHNFKKSELLKFIVLDELHTYEGAQGSDVANLIRRLKLKLEIPPDQLCPVGTSATIGKGEESKKLLTDFASKVFGEEVSEDAIIEEHRLSLEDFFAGHEQRNFLPTLHMLKGSRLKSGDDFDEFIKNLLNVWGIDPNISQTALSGELKNYQIIKDLIKICNEGIISLDELITRLNRLNKEFAVYQNKDNDDQFFPKEAVVRSILSLISYAKSGDKGRLYPFLYLQIQVWIRELSGFVRVLDRRPLFKWREDILTKDGEKAFPVYFCRECGASGWFAVKHDNKDRFENDINDVYHKFFTHNKNLYLVATYKNENVCIEEYEPTDKLEGYLNIKTLSLTDRGGENTIEVIAYRKLAGNYNLHICPSCNSRNTINIIGQRVATLASVTTSQLLSTDLDPSDEKYRKILAFSNSVQDAAHQAGFLEARNYRFTFRTALQKVVNLLNSPVSLTELQKEFVDYWSTHSDESGENHLEAYYYKFFPADHVADVSIERYKKKPDEFKEEFNNRISWEIVSEFGYNAIIGRTLEKTGSSSTFFNMNTLSAVFSEMKPWMDENVLYGIQEQDFQKFLIIFLQRLRIRGGVDHLYLNKFRTGRSSYYQITQGVNKQHFLMRNFGKNTRLPKFITDQTNVYGVFDLTTIAKGNNWFHGYYKKSFPMMQGNVDLINEFYSKLLETLAMPKIGLFERKEAQGVSNYSLSAHSLYIQKNAIMFECSSCGNRITVAEPNIELIKDAKCIVHRCGGSYQVSSATPTDNYYKQVYNRGKAPRVYAADHTGLLDRKVREELESDFKTRPKFDSKNTLVATSTLEMGIDIGSLNSLINTSIPPLPSNFLQRVGRAGRSTGSAIVINFAPNEAHDLYYFETPLEMMDGEINTPGCYLDAKEIIRRHYFAYCIDSWTKDDPGKNTIPNLIRFLGLESADLNNPEFFLNRLTAYIKANYSFLLNSYQKAFRGKVDENIFKELNETIQTRYFFDFLKRPFLDLKAEIASLKQKQKGMSDYAKLKKLDTTDPEYIELQKDFRNISASLMLIRKRNVIEFMINEGLLPNYAFPETGVTLKAQISKKRDDDLSKYDIKSLEVVRSARSALREFLPECSFYTQGYKLEISGINIVSWKEDFVDYRFCSDCDQIAVDIPPVVERCPKCGSETWKSPRNVHKAHRLKAVTSFTDEKDARLDDSSEERIKKISRITQHFQFNPSGLQGSWVMQRIPFGIEYCKDVNIFEFNSGLQDSRVLPNNNVRINEVEVPKQGYIICKNCGKVTCSIFDEKHAPILPGDYHFGFCKNKTIPYQNEVNEFFEEVFFFREMETEAIKILLPVQEFNTEASIKLFKAGITFGLKKYFRGKPDHLAITEYSEYNQQTSKKDQFLVIYDTIPGGTGYLAKLFDKDEFNLILKQAFINIRDCKCQYNGKDGCYNCIFTYGNQFEREELSRLKAEELFGRIISSANDWDYLPSGLGKITNSGKIEESELEEKFVRELAVYFNNPARKTQLLTKTEDGVTKYILKIKSNDKELIYEIRPQVELGPLDGVRYTTIADFMITPLLVKEGIFEINRSLSDYKPIAVYLDGYQFHASKENNRFVRDIEKRKSIFDSNKYHVWTLTWKDLELFDDPLAERSNNGNDTIRDKYEGEIPPGVKQIIRQHPFSRSLKSELQDCKNNFQRFIWFLENYTENNLIEKFKYLSFHFQSNFPQNCLSELLAEEFVNTPHKAFGDFFSAPTQEGYLYLDLLSKDSFYEFRILQKLKSLEYLGKLYIKENELELNKNSWELFWCIFNVLQFGFGNIEVEYLDRQKSDSPQLEPYAETILDNFDEKYHPVVEELVKSGVSFNHDNYFHLKNEDNQIIAEAFLGLQDYKIVIDPLGEISTTNFISAGYKVYTLENFDISKIE